MAPKDLCTTQVTNVTGPAAAAGMRKGLGALRATKHTYNGFPGFFNRGLQVDVVKKSNGVHGAHQPQPATTLAQSDVFCHGNNLLVCLAHALVL